MFEETSPDAPLLVELSDDGVARITLNRPDKRNALDAPQWERLTAALADLAAKPGLRCLVLTGAGDSFSAGGDLSQLVAEIDTETGPARFRARIHHCLEALYAFPAPTIARVNGPAIGGGLELSIGCDIRIGTPATRFGMPAVRFGMVIAYPDLARFASIVGLDRARYLALTTEVVDGEESFRIGLLHQLVTADKLDTATDRMVRRMLAMEPGAVDWVRRAARSLEPQGEIGAMRAYEEDCLRTPEFRRRVAEFMNK